VLNRQREVIYAERRQVLHGADLHEQIRHFLDDVVTGYVMAETSDGFADDWDLDKLWNALKMLYPVGITVADVEEEAGGRSGVTQDMLLTELRSDIQVAYDNREESLGEEETREFERRVVLAVLDRKWREHLYEMDYLQEGIGLRAMAQRDPLVEYQREGFLLFEAMTEAIKEESVSYLFQLEVEVGPAEADELGEELPAVGDGSGSIDDDPLGDGGGAGDGKPVGATRRPAIIAKGLDNRGPRGERHYSAPSIDGDAEPEVRAEAAEPSRANPFPNASLNGPCPCGSGKKYKRCHGATRGAATA
jgi:preprotein translocase subunit SecA